MVTNDELIDYLFKKTGWRLTNKSVLFDDIHIDGIEADILINELSKDFNLNIEKFDFKKYYLPDNKIGNIFLDLFNSIFRREKLKKNTFTLQHLADVINSGEWYDPS